MAENNIPKIEEEIVEEQIQEEPTQIKSPNVSPVTRDTQGNLSTWFTPLKEETVTDEAIIQEPEPVAPVEPKSPEAPVVTPEVTTEAPKEEVKIEEKAPKQPTSKVETAQDIKSKETLNEAQENELNEAKKNQTTTELQKMIENGATVEELVKFWNNNKKFLWEIQNVMRGAFKNQSNVKYFGKYSTMNNDDMYASYKEWLVVPWSEEYNLLPPEKKRSFDNFLKIKQSTNAVSKTDYSQSDNVLNTYELESVIPKMFNTNIRENYKNALNSPEILWITDKIAWKRAEIDKLDIEMEDLQDNLTKSFAWDLPWSIRAKVKQEYNAKVKEKRLLLAEHSAYVWQFQSLKSDAETELKISMYEDGIYRDNYNTELNLYETRRKEKRADLAATSKAQAELENKAFEAENKRIAADLKYQRDLQLKQFESNLKKEQKWGIYETDRQWRQVYIKDWVSSFVRDVEWEVLFTEDKSEEWYKDTTMKENWVFVTTRTYTDWRKPEYFTYDINWNSSTNSNNTVNNLISNIKWDWQCWAAVNRYVTGQLWISSKDFWMWDSYKSKKRYINDSTPTVWWVAIWNDTNAAGWKFAENWHTWIVTWYDLEKWTVQITDWNWNWDEKKDTHDVKISDIIWSDWGFYNPDSIPKAAWYISADVPMYKTFLTKWSLNSTDRKAFTKDEFETFKAQAEIYQKEQTSKWTKQIERLLDIIRRVRQTNPWRAWRIGSTLPGATTINPDLADYNAAFEALLNNKAFNELVELKKGGATFGSLTETEFANIWKSATSISQSLSDKAYLAELDRIESNLKRWISQERLSELEWTSDIKTEIKETTTKNSILQEYKKKKSARNLDYLN